MSKTHARKKDFDRRLWRRFWHIAKPFWFGEQKWLGRGMLALLVLLLIGRTEFIVVFNTQSGEFTSALAAHEPARFWHSMRVFGIALVVAVRCTALTTMCAIGWHHLAALPHRSLLAQVPEQSRVLRPDLEPLHR